MAHPPWCMVRSIGNRIVYDWTVVAFERSLCEGPCCYYAFWGPHIVSLREELRGLIHGSARPMAAPVALSPSLACVESTPRPWPLDAVYVGHGPIGSGLNPSPWGVALCFILMQ